MAGQQNEGRDWYRRVSAPNGRLQADTHDSHEAVRRAPHGRDALRSQDESNTAKATIPGRDIAAVALVPPVEAGGRCHCVKLLLRSVPGSHAGRVPDPRISLWRTLRRRAPPAPRRRSRRPGTRGWGGRRIGARCSHLPGRGQGSCGLRRSGGLSRPWPSTVSVASLAETRGAAASRSLGPQAAAMARIAMADHCAVSLKPFPSRQDPAAIALRGNFVAMTKILVHRHTCTPDHKTSTTRSRRDAPWRTAPRRRSRGGRRRRPPTRAPREARARRRPCTPRGSRRRRASERGARAAHRNGRRRRRRRAQVPEPHGLVVRARRDGIVVAQHGRDAGAVAQGERRFRRPQVPALEQAVVGAGHVEPRARIAPDAPDLGGAARRVGVRVPLTWLSATPVVGAPARDPARVALGDDQRVGPVPDDVREEVALGFRYRRYVSAARRTSTKRDAGRPPSPPPTASRAAPARSRRAARASPRRPAQCFAGGRGRRRRRRPRPRRSRRSRRRARLRPRRGRRVDLGSSICIFAGA